MKFIKVLFLFVAFSMSSLTVDARTRHGSYDIDPDDGFDSMLKDLETAYCEISNSVNYMYNYMDRDDGGLFVYKADDFSLKAKQAVVRAYGVHRKSDGNLNQVSLLPGDSENLALAKDKIVAAHDRINGLTLYDPNRNSIRQNLVSPAKAAIKSINKSFGDYMDLEACDTKYPDN